MLRHARAQLPEEDFIYIADSGFAPYGERSADWIRARSLALAGHLLDRGAKALLVACNTATAAAAPALRERWPRVPVIAMEPAVKPAVAATRCGTVGVLATTGTLASSRFAALLDTFGRDIRVVTRSGSGLVEAVERGDFASDATRSLVRSHVRPLIDAGADVIVLGCTHYPFLRPLIQQEAGPGVSVIDTGLAVSRQLQRRLDEAGLRRHGPAGTEHFLTSARPEHALPALRALWHAAADLSALSLEDCDRAS